MQEIEESYCQESYCQAVARAMKEEAVNKIKELGRNTNNVFRFVRKIRIESTDVVGGRCMRGNDGALYLNAKDRTKPWKTHVKNNEWMGSNCRYSSGTNWQSDERRDNGAFKYLKIGKVPGQIEVYAEMILARGYVGNWVLVELCQRLINGWWMPEDWATSVGKWDIMYCGMHRAVKLLEHVKKIVEKVLEKNCSDRWYAIRLYARQRYNWCILHFKADTRGILS